VTPLRLSQPGRGYRFSIDPFLLAAFVRPRPRERLADLGAGVGVIGLILAARHPTLSVTAIEVQPALSRHARANAAANGLAGRCTVVEGDLREAPRLLPRGTFDRVVANPPFRAPGAGRVSVDPGRALARQEVGATLADFAAAAAALLRHGGAFDLVHTPARLPELVRTLAAAGLEAKRLRMVVPTPGAAPRLLLLEACRGGRPGLAVLPELAVHERPGHYSPEVALALAAAAGRP